MPNTTPSFTPNTLISSKQVSAAIGLKADAVSGVLTTPELASATIIDANSTAIAVLGETLSATAFYNALGTTDWAKAIQAAHDYAAARGLAGVVIDLPAIETMAWDSTVTITTPIRLRGHGIGASRFVISTVLSGNGYLIVNAGSTSSEVQVHFEGFTALFTQPDTATQSQLTQYPPFFYIDATPRVRFDRIRIAAGWRGIAFNGNSGGAEVNWLQTSCLYKNVEIDGCLDTMSLFRWHCYPFDLSANQQKVFYSSGCIGLYSGRCDDLKVTACLWYCGSNSAVTLIAGQTGSTFGVFTACDFDNFGALNMAAGDVNLVGCSITLGDSTSSAILLSGGDLNVTGTIVLCQTAPANNAIIAVTGGNLTTAGLTIKKAVDTQALLMSAGTILASLTVVEPDITTAYTSSLLYLTGGDGIIETNATPHQVTAGRPGVSLVGNLSFVLRGEINNRIINCSAEPAATDINISGLTNPIVADRVISPLRTRVLASQPVGSNGGIQVPHGVTQGQLKIISAQAFCQTANGSGAPMTLVSIDSTYLNFSGGGAGQTAKVVFEYTDFPTNW